MTDITPKAAEALVKSFGPTDDDRRRFAATFVGSLLGQTVVLVGLIVTYIAAIVLIYRYALEDLLSIYNTIGKFWFGIAAFFPVAFILGFSALPTALRASRERHLRSLTLADDGRVGGGYFRLYPYDAADRKVFRRLDGAGARILNWLRTTSEPVLYVSGPSGVGKSSVMAAEVLPNLRDADWTVIETRIFGSPRSQILSALVGERQIFGRLPPPDLSLRDLVAKAAASCVRAGKSPLMLVIDQFEEFLILNDDDKRRNEFSDFVKQIVDDPVRHFHLLLIFRSDYGSLIFKEQLPALNGNRNWQEVSPYSRRDATVFMHDGGRWLGGRGIEGLFDGLDKIEEARGLYRTVTLNMVGLVLERMGDKIEGDPGKLIQTYLRSAINVGQARDFAKLILSKMITDEGTKEPRSVETLISLTDLQSWQVQATLAELAQKGLVRRLDGQIAIWEVAHDFLARLLGQIIGQSAAPSPVRLKAWLAPLALIGWIVVALVSLPFANSVREAAAQEKLHANGKTTGPFPYQPEIDFGSFSLEWLTRYGQDKGLFVAPLYDDDLVELGPDLANLRGFAGLHCYCDDLRPLERFKEVLMRLDLELHVRIDLHEISGLKNLKRLTILQGSTESVNQIDLSPIESHSGLIYLQISGRRSPLPSTGRLKISSLQPLLSLTKLEGLALDGYDPSELSLLMRLKSLKLLALGTQGMSMQDFLSIKPIVQSLKDNGVHVSVECLPDERGARKFFC